jgi:hypothetical protein
MQTRGVQTRVVQTHSEEPGRDQEGKNNGLGRSSSAEDSQQLMELLGGDTPRSLKKVKPSENRQGKMGHCSYADSIKKKPQRQQFFKSPLFSEILW